MGGAGKGEGEEEEGDLEIPVDNVFVVEVFQGREDLANDIGSRDLRQRPIGANVMVKISPRGTGDPDEGQSGNDQDRKKMRGCG